jgi:4a-hydroxytetrahydrobiopterin dehydratase
MLGDDRIVAAAPAEWRKLGQGLHARFVVEDFVAGAELVAAIAAAGRPGGHYPQVRIGDGFVDLKLITDDAIFRDDDGREHVVEWVTQQDLDLADVISELARQQGLRSDVGAITAVELVLDTAHAPTVAPVWSALLTGGDEALGRGTISDDVRDPTWRMPILGFQATEEHETPRQRFHLDVQVPYDVAETRIAAAVAAGATIVDDSRAPWTTVLADPDGNRACIGVSAVPDA